MHRVWALESKAIAQGASLMFGGASKEFFEQIYENDATIVRAVSASRRKGK